MKYGIRDGLLRKPFDELFAEAHRLGFDGVEFCIGNDYRDSLLWQPGGAAKLRAAAESGGVVISSLSPGVFASVHPALPDDAKREEGRAILRHVIESCPAAGATDILVPMFPRDVAEWTDGTWARLVDAFKEHAEYAGRHGVTLDLETTLDARQLATVIERVGSPRVKVYYDTANCTNFGYDAAADIRALGERVGMIHAKDTEKQMLGGGRVDFDGVDAAMREISYDGWIVLETPTGDDPSAANARNLAFVRKLGRAG